MGLLYDVYYPHSRSSDNDVPDAYLARLQAMVRAGEKAIVGAEAVVQNGPAETLRLCADGEWR